MGRQGGKFRQRMRALLALAVAQRLQAHFAAGQLVRAEHQRKGRAAGIGGIGVTWEALDFDQLGHAIDRTPQDGLRRPEVLQSITVQDTIDGNFRFAIQDPMSGEWEGLP